MLVDKPLDDICPECGEQMEVVRDYGLSGEALECRSCGFSKEQIELGQTKLSGP